MEHPKRKEIRLKGYDYTQDGIYHITICSENRKNIFSEINIKQDLETATTELTQAGNIAKEQLLSLKSRYNSLDIITYVIMPNHIHIIMSILDSNINIPDIIRAYKSLVTNECRKNLGMTKVFQRSYNDHIIRNEKDLYNAIEYVQHNPGKWIYDKYYSDGTIAT